MPVHSGYGTQATMFSAQLRGVRTATGQETGGTGDDHTQMGGGGRMDLIERKAAIDAVGYYSLHSGDKLLFADKALKELPSAQPEIIRCKDCKYWMPHTQLGFDEDNDVYHDYCEKLIPEDEWYAFQRKDDDFCSRAERRTE